MSGFHKGKAAIPAKGKRRPWERTYRTLTALRAKMPAAKKVDVRGAVVAMTTFEAKPGLGGRRHRLRRMKAVRS